MKLAVIILSLLLWSSNYDKTPSLNNGRYVAQELQTVTLFSKNKYKEDPRTACLKLDAALRIYRCDLRYGTLYAGDDLDWFQSGATAINRSIIRDLGEYLWSDAFTVPVVEPLPKLKPGEQRRVIVDTSGADGADGLPGKRGENGVNADGTVLPNTEPTVVDAPSRPRRDGKPKIDPIFVKAVVGHLYVIHVVDETSDFYALFRVESLERGDQCTISWRKIPAPEQQAEKAVE